MNTVFQQSPREVPRHHFESVINRYEGMITYLLLSMARKLMPTKRLLQHLARTLATNGGMNNEWLKSQGLISIKELWVNIHYPATAR